jgi:hypothetical protein
VSAARRYVSSGGSGNMIRGRVLRKAIKPYQMTDNRPKLFVTTWKDKRIYYVGDPRLGQCKAVYLNGRCIAIRLPHEMVPWKNS